MVPPLEKPVDSFGITRDLAAAQTAILSSEQNSIREISEIEDDNE
jgi:hypothetical protein